MVTGITNGAGKSIIPNGYSTLKEGDTVVVAVLRQATKFIQKLFG
ncbi:hypothetical protein DYP60_02365 [Sphaerochaeta halotolerans]|uniref:RCK C-terminal domain-containing protein n=1 Tax=Sphaerochaeta halotolerans TaxID=2293840 RepID=A0A372ML04_9SPIR|nr:hypothetical protein DYP60_02365 [Sphaerochaeta halotolerans]